ncbi:MAG: hypothetical protein IJ174_00030, partial [Clostridia bacterium]|nr:hypothetical protein [Clostridia bacterium]
MDIGLVAPDGEDVHAGADVNVKTNIALPEAPEQDGRTGRAVVKNARLFHVIGETEVEELPVEVETENGAITALRFSTESFSGFALSYTVDFEYSINGQTYEFTLPGGGFIPLRQLAEALGVVSDDDPDALDRFVQDIQDAAFSDPSLVWIGKVESNTTLGAVKAAQNLECEYSAELTEDEIAQLNETTIAAGEWILISLKPFTTEETLTVTMQNGDVWTVKVTDAQEIPDAEKDTIDVNKSYLICYQVGNDYYMLKNDGSTEKITTATPDTTFEGLNSTYAWTFNYIFQEHDVEANLDKNYYLIRPIDNKSKTLTLNNTGESIVQSGNNNAAVIADNDGFYLEGYHNVGTDEHHRYIRLNFSNGTFTGVDGQGVLVHIWEMDALPTYDYTVRSSDPIRGTVTVVDGTPREETIDGVTTYWTDATSTNDKKNAGTITAEPVEHEYQGKQKWLFDHWEQDGTPLDRDAYPATIAMNTLPIPFNGSELVAYFKQNPDYTVPDSEKTPTTVGDMSQWRNSLISRDIPLDEEATLKTSEVYDYENRIYRVDIASKANFETFDGNVQMGFCMDVSNSMLFPSKLVPSTTFYNNHTNPIPIYTINGSTWNGRAWISHKNWLDTSRDWNNPYYLIADATGTATVFKIYYKDDNWKAQDASRQTEIDQSFVIGNDFGTSWTYGQQDQAHPFSAGDNNNTTYMIYDSGDEHNRFYYLENSFNGAVNNLSEIVNMLKVAGASSPVVSVGYNTFNKNVTFGQDFSPVTNGISFTYANGGGTRTDLALEQFLP